MQWPPATWSGRQPSTSFAVDPYCYPGTRPDGTVVATIVPDPGRTEPHHVLALTEEQLAEVDEWEGPPDWYERRAFEGPVLLESGTVPDDVWVYVGTEALRPRLLVEGRSLRVAEHCQADVDGLVS